MSKESILIRVLGNIGDAICAEPALREYIKQNPDIDIYLQSRCPELFYDYPGIKQSMHIEEQVNRKHYTKYKRARPDWVHHIIDYLPRSLDIKIEDRIPNLSHIKNENMQELRLNCKFENTIAVSINPSNKIREWDKWNELIIEIKKLGYKTLQLDHGVTPLDGIAFDMVGKTSIRQAATILRKVKLFVAIDSGLSHLAAAVGTKCICLFGPVDPAIRVHDNLTIPVRSNACGYCMPTYKGIKGCPLKHHDCMVKLTVDEVLTQIKNHI